MSFFIEDYKSLKKYNGTQNKAGNSIRKELDCERIYHKKFLKTKIRFYCYDAADFCDNEIPKAGSNYTCFAVISIDSVLKKEKNYYP